MKHVPQLLKPDSAIPRGRLREVGTSSLKPYEDRRWLRDRVPDWGVVDGVYIDDFEYRYPVTGHSRRE